MLASLVAVGAVAGIVWHERSPSRSVTSSTHDYPGGVRVVVPTGSLPGGAQVRVSPTTLPAPAPPGITVVGPFVDVQAMGGTLTGPLRVELPLAHPDRYRVGGRGGPVAVVGLHYHGGRWSVVPATFDPRTGRATVVVTSLSPIGLGSVADLARRLLKSSIDTLTGGIYKDVERPSCAPRPASDDFHVVDTDPGSTALLFCVDSGPSGSHLVRIVNQKRYAILATGGVGATPEDAHPGELASQLSALITTPREVALDPGGSVTFRIAANVTRTSITSQFDGLAQSLTSLEVAADVLSTIATKVPFSKVKDEAEAQRQLLAALDLADCMREAGINLDSLVHDAVSRIPGLVTSCLSPERLQKIFGSVIGGVVGGVVGLAASVISYTWSSVLATYDLVRSGAESDLEIAAGDGVITQPNPVPGANPVMLVVDVSGSMGDPDGNGRIKIEGAKQALLNFLQGVEAGTPIGLRTYPDQQNSSSCNPGSVRFALQPRDPADMSAEIRTLAAEGDTPTAEAMLAAADDIRAAGYSHGTMVVVSDGESTCADPCEAAKAIEKTGIALQTITVGFRISDAGRKQLQCIANSTRGTYVDADDSAALASEFDTLSRPTISVTIDAPATAPVDSGNDPSGLVHLKATVANTSNQEARDVVARLRFDAVTPAVAEPVVTLGNLEARASRTLDWTFRPSVLLAGDTVKFTVIARADNLGTDAQGGGAVKVVDEATAGQAGPLLRKSGAIAILGDSYSAGEGAGDYLAATNTDANRCHRSRKTYLVSKFSLSDADIIACSGAVTNDVDHADSGDHVPSQIDQLSALEQTPKGVSAVVMTLGGNDAGFSEVVGSCLLLEVDCSKRIYPSPIPIAGVPTKGVNGFVSTHFADLEDHLASDYEAIDAVLNSKNAVAKRGSEAPILVLAYPIPIPESKRPCPTLTTLTPTEVAFLVQYATELNGHVEAAVAAAHGDGAPVFYVPDTEDAFLPDHTVCDDVPFARGLETFKDAGIDWQHVLDQGVKDDRYPWYVRIPGIEAKEAWAVFSRSKQQLVHPNASGYDALTTAIVRWSQSGAAKTAASSLGHRATTTGVVGTWSISDEDLGQLSGTAPDLQPATSYNLGVSGFGGNTPVEIEVRSVPRQLGTGQADGTGALHTRVALPAGLATGRHELVIRGVGPDGAPRVVEIPFHVSGSLLPHGARLVALAAGCATALACVAWLITLVAWRRRGRAR